MHSTCAIRFHTHSRRRPVVPPHNGLFRFSSFLLTQFDDFLLSNYHYPRPLPSCRPSTPAFSTSCNALWCTCSNYPRGSTGDPPPHLIDYFGQPVATNPATLAVFGNPTSPDPLPHSLEFVGKTFENNPELFAKLPNFNQVLCSISECISPYVHGSLLPGGVPSNASYTWDWQAHCPVPEKAIKRAHHESAVTARVRFVKKVYARLMRTPHQVCIPGSLGLDTYCYRTEREVSYCEVLSELDAAAWTGDNRYVAQSALCWDRPLLRSDFRFASREGNSNWQMVAWERRMRYRTGRLIPYYCIESEGMTSFAREKLCATTPFWERLETSRNCTAELPPIVTYMSSYLIDDPNSGWWTVLYTEFVARQAFFVLLDVYDDSCRL